MISHMISHMISCCVQDCVVLLAPYPNNPNQVESFNIKTDFDLKGDGLVWYARPQLFFNCTLCPTGAKESMYSASHKEVSLVYFSTFEPIALIPDSIMQQAGVPMLYDLASNQRLPCLYICPVANVLGCAPLILCFIGCNSHPTNSTQLQGPSSPWKRLRQHAVGQGQRQQAVQGEHLDVALRQGPPPDGVHSRG